MSKTLKKLSLIALGALLALSVAATFAFAPKNASAKAGTAVAVNATITNADRAAGWSYGDALKGSGDPISIQGGEWGVSYAFSIANAAYTGEMSMISMIFGPANADGKGAPVAWDGKATVLGQFSLWLRVDGDNSEHCVIWVWPMDPSTGSPIKKYSEGGILPDFTDWALAGTGSWGEDFNFNISFKSDGANYTFMVGDANLTSYFNAYVGSSFMNSNYQTNVALGNVNNVELPGTLKFVSYTPEEAESGSTPTLPSGAIGGLLYGGMETRWTYYASQGKLFQAGEFGANFEFGVKLEDALSGLPGIELAFGPDTNDLNTGETGTKGHFKVGLMLNGGDSKMYLTLSDNTSTESTVVKDIQVGSLSANSYLKFTLSFAQGDDGVWYMELSTPGNNASDGTEFNAMVGGAFLSNTYQMNVAITKATSVVADAVLFSATAQNTQLSKGGSGGEEPVETDPLPTGALGGLMYGDTAEEWSYYDKKGSLYQAGKDGLEVNVGIQLKQTLTAHYSVGISVGNDDKVQAIEGTAGAGHFVIDLMLNYQWKVIFLRLISNNGTVLIGHTQLSNTDLVAGGSYINLKVSFKNPDGAGTWYLLVNDEVIGGTTFNDNIGGSFMTSDNKANVAILKVKDAPANAVLYSVAGIVDSVPTGYYLVKFYNGDSLYDTKTVQSGRTVAKPSDPDALVAGFLFDGWYNEDTDSAWNFGSAVTENINLRAHFYVVEEPDDPDPDDPINPSDPSEPEKPNGENPSSPAEETKKDEGGCGSGITAELPLITLPIALAFAAAVVVIKKKKSAK